MALSVQSTSTFVDNLQASGRYTFTDRDLYPLKEDRSKTALKTSLRRLTQNGRITCPRRGFYVIVPLEYREAGCPPASWFIHDLMTYLGQPYYVALLSAATIHGAGHQQPMVSQIMTDRPVREIQSGRVRIEFHVSRNIQDISTTTIQTETGTIQVSTPESTALDLVKYAPASGGIDHIRTVLMELQESLDPELLVSEAKGYSIADVQRLGFLLDDVSDNKITVSLGKWLATKRFRRIPLDPSDDGPQLVLDTKWRIYHRSDKGTDR